MPEFGAFEAFHTVARGRRQHADKRGTGRHRGLPTVEKLSLFKFTE